jgi:hypothetical protein
MQDATTTEVVRIFRCVELSAPSRRSGAMIDPSKELSDMGEMVRSG